MIIFQKCLLSWLQLSLLFCTFLPAVSSAVIYEDSFNRAGSTTVGTTSDGRYTWTEAGNAERAAIYNTTLSIWGSGGDGRVYVPRNMDTVTKYRIEFDLFINTSLDSAPAFYIVPRGGDSDSYYNYAFCLKTGSVVGSQKAIQVGWCTPSGYSGIISNAALTGTWNHVQIDVDNFSFTITFGSLTDTETMKCLALDGNADYFQIGYCWAGDYGVYNWQIANFKCSSLQTQGDANGDLMVTYADVEIVSANLGSYGSDTWEQGDFNGDKNVDAADWSALWSNWGSGSGNRTLFSQDFNISKGTVPVPWSYMVFNVSDCGISIASDAGNPCMQFALPSPGGIGSVYIPMMKVRDTECNVNLTFSYKTAVNPLHLVVAMSSGAGGSWPAYKKNVTLNSDGAWHTASVTFEPDPNAPDRDTFEFVFDESVASGQILLLDNIVLQEVPLETDVRLTSPSSQYIIASLPDQNARIKLCSRTSNTAFLMKIFQGSGTTPIYQNTRYVTGTDYAELAFGSYSADDYRIDINTPGHPTPWSWTITKDPYDANHAVVVNEATYVKDQYRLILGLYHADWLHLYLTNKEDYPGDPNYWEPTADQQKTLCNSLTTRGFTATISSSPSGAYGFNVEALKYGLLGIIQPYADATYLLDVNTINPYVDLQNLLGWYSVDEPFGYMVPRCEDIYHEFKDIDPYRSVFAAVWPDQVDVIGRKFVDVGCVDWYPFYNESNSVDEVAFFTKMYYDLFVKENRSASVCVTPQLFTQDAQWGAYIPTYNQIRAETYAGLISGARGVMYFAYWVDASLADGMENNADRHHWYLPESSLWDQIGTLNWELQAIKDLILFGNTDSSITFSADPNVLAKGFIVESDGQRFIMVVNQIAYTVNNTQVLGLQAGENLRPLFGSPLRSSTWIDLPGYGIGVYRVVASQTEIYSDNFDRGAWVQDLGYTSVGSYAWLDTDTKAAICNNTLTVCGNGGNNSVYVQYDLDSYASYTVEFDFKVDPGLGTAPAFYFLPRATSGVTIGSEWAVQKNTDNTLTLKYNGSTVSSNAGLAGTWIHVRFDAGVDTATLYFGLLPADTRATNGTASNNTADYVQFAYSWAGDYGVNNWQIDNLELNQSAATRHSPVSSSTGVSIIPTLSWASGICTPSHDVYFGTNQTNVTNATRASAEYKGNQAGTTYVPGTLSVSTTYYWRIDEVVNGGATIIKGIVRSFTTAATPGQATTPSPAYGATGVSTKAVFAWTAGSGATSHDVYFGTNQTNVTNATKASAEYQGNTSNLRFSTGVLGAGTTYYWRVDEAGNGGTTKGTVWSFTTVTNSLTFVAAGSVTSGTGTITPSLPAGIARDDILLLFVETANQVVSITNHNGGMWTEVTNSPQGTGTAGATTATRLTAFWSRYNGSQGAPTVSDSGDHQLGRIIAIRGAVASGNPWDVTASGVESTSDTSGSIPGATTTVANTLVVAVVAASLPDATGTANFSSWANGNLTSVTERTDNTVTAGNGGGLGVVTGIKATAGAYGNTTVTHASAAIKGMMSIAIKP